MDKTDPDTHHSYLLVAKVRMLCLTCWVSAFIIQRSFGTGIVCLKAELSFKHLSDWKIWSLFSTGQAASQATLITAPAARPGQHNALETHAAKGRVAWAVEPFLIHASDLYHCSRAHKPVWSCDAGLTFSPGQHWISIRPDMQDWL